MAPSKHFFKVNNIILAKVHLERPPQLPEKIELELRISIRIIKDRLPDILQVIINATTSEEQDVQIDISIVGLFGRNDGMPDPSDNDISEFVAQQALFGLWSRIDQTVVTLSAQMGMSPIHLDHPIKFDLSQSQD